MNKSAPGNDNLEPLRLSEESEGTREFENSILNARKSMGNGAKEVEKGAEELANDLKSGTDLGIFELYKKTKDRSSRERPL